MANLIFTAHGIQVHMPREDAEENWRGDGDGFEGRVPLLWNKKTRNLFVGNPDWYHADVYQHHHVPDRDYDDLQHGYIGSPNPEWGGGNLAWYGHEPAEHADVAKALMEAGFQVPNPKPEEKPPEPEWQTEQDSSADDVDDFWE